MLGPPGGWLILGHGGTAPRTSMKVNWSRHRWKLGRDGVRQARCLEGGYLREIDGGEPERAKVQ